MSIFAARPPLRPTRENIRWKWEHGSLQQFHGDPNYVKRGFGWTPLDLLGPAVNVAAGLVPGGNLVAAGLGLTGGQGMNGGYDPWVGIGGWGVGACGPNQRCVGGSAGGVCFGTCVAAGPQVSQPWQDVPITGVGPDYGGPVYQAPANGNGRGLCCPPGMRPNKSAYFTRGIKDGGGPRWVPAGTKCVSSRRTNPLNPRAASRAGRRLRSAARASKWLAQVKVPKKMR